MARSKSKQKVKRHYGVLERQFRNYFVYASRQTGVTGEVLLQKLERRLDNVVYRLGFAASRASARQLVRHRHNTDPTRTYLAGWSGGATYIGYRAAAWSEHFAAVSLAGGGAPPARPDASPCGTWNAAPRACPSAWARAANELPNPSPAIAAALCIFSRATRSSAPFS